MGQGAYILAPKGLDLSPKESAFFREADPWGFILFARNCETPDQLRRLTSDLRTCVGRDAPILIDQEGGRVQRMRAPHWAEWMPPLDQVEALSFKGNGPELFENSGAVRAMYLRGLLIGTELKAHGIDTNCAPSADIAAPETHPFLRNRCYGSDAQTVVGMARACANGLMAAGVLPVLKHAPGHGRATLDSHKALPLIETPLSALQESDFAPFRALCDLPMAMTAHIVLPEIDPDLPVTMSAKGVALLRQDLGLTNLLMTDDISMGALSGSLEDKAIGALGAGCDLILHCNGELSEMETLATATAGLFDEAAQVRAQAALDARKTPIDIDIPALQAEFDALIEGAKNA